MRSKSLLVCLSLVLFLISPSAFSFGGYGAYGLMPQCNLEVAGGSVDISDELDEIDKDMREAKKEQNKKESEKRKLTRELEESKRKLERAFGQSGKGIFLFEHMNNDNSCFRYEGCYFYSGADAYGACGAKRRLIDGRGQEDLDRGDLSTEPYGQSEWHNLCNISNKGLVHADRACQGANDRSQCTSLINGMRNKITKLRILDVEIESAKERYAAQKERRRDLTDEAKAEQEEAYEEALEGGCPGCIISGNRAYQPRRPGKWEMLGGVLSAGAGALAGYFGAKNAVQVNAQLGFPTNPSAGFGWPMGMMMGAMGLYGAVTGGMTGGFGCNSGFGGGSFGPGGLMGYPSGMYPGMPGGGMYLGMGGPFGMNPMMSGMGMGGMFGMPGMGMGGMFGMPGMGMGGMFGMPGMGMGGMFGMPGMGMGGMPGMGMGGMFGMPGMGMGGMFGMPGMGMGGMFGMPGMGMGGMPGMGMGGMFGMPGMGMGGMFGMPGMGMGGMPGMGMNGMMGMDGGLGGFQMQQQMMQMQMQQAQIYMEQQRRMQENMMAKQRVVSGIQQEIYSAIYRLNQAQMGIGLGVDLTMPAPPTGVGYYPPSGVPGGYYPSGVPGGYGYQPLGVPASPYGSPYAPGSTIPVPGAPGVPGGYYPQGPGTPVIPQRGPGVNVR